MITLQTVVVILFSSAMNCPNGSPAECPSGQLCYFDTPCDARIEGGLLGDPTGSPTPAPTPGPTASRAPIPYVDLGIPDGRHNFCGSTVSEASANCDRERHCPSGSSVDCPEDMYCWIDLRGCNVKEIPSMKPTVSHRPTPRPTHSPTTRDPSFTYEPTVKPLDKDDIRNFFFCGTSWLDASKRCYQRCLSGHHAECTGDEECFAMAACKKVVEAQPPAPSPGDGSTASDRTPFPTPSADKTPEPTNSPLEKDDWRNFFFCGISWMDASTRCYRRCVTGHHVECPADEECFAQAACKEGVIEQITESPTVEPTMAPFDGRTRSPTISRAPTASPTEPAPTAAPARRPTSSPTDGPTDIPTTPFPTNKPTYAPCAGEPCRNKQHCRSSQNFCGAGKYYCNEKSIWVESCGVPTDPPTSAAPTTIWPSTSPTASSAPTVFPTEPPTENPTLEPPTQNPTRLPEVVYHLKTDRPTDVSPFNAGPPSKEIANRPSVRTEDEEEDAIKTSPPTSINEKYYAPGDSLGTFFCGTDWNHAISECPHRCPSGEASQCPSGWACYAFTPCVGVGIQPTMKPTWEPTKKPTPKPTRTPTPKPTTTQQYWNEQNKELNARSRAPNTEAPSGKPTSKPVWTYYPTPRPSYEPTQDRCHAPPCDYEGECRSRLGFCGTGIVYCNSASTWVQSCGGGGALIRLELTTSPIGVPTTSPSDAFVSWFKMEDNDPDDVVVASKVAIDAADDDRSKSYFKDKESGVGNAPVDESTIETEEEATPTFPGYDPDGWSANWDSRAKDDGDDNGDDEDLRWWIHPNLSSTQRLCLPSEAIMWALFFIGIVIHIY